jgi:hypothetical protein
MAKMMNIKEAEQFLRLHWDITRKAWNGKKYIHKAQCSPIIDLVENGVYSKFEGLSDEDYDAKDWMLFVPDKSKEPDKVYTEPDNCRREWDENRKSAYQHLKSRW